jgi:hypothetical protein
MLEPEYYSFDFGRDVGIIKFRDRSDIKDFVEKQNSAYFWIRNSQAEVTTQQLIGRFINSLSHTVATANSEINDAQYFAKLEHQFRGIFIDGNLPVAGYKDFEFIEYVRQNKGGIAAAGALCYITKEFNHLWLASKDIWVGLLIAFNREEGIGNTSATQAKTSYDKLTAKAQTTIANSEQMESNRQRKFGSALNKFNERSKVLVKWQTRKHNRLLDSIVLQNSAAIDNLDKVKKTYEELMALRAPVDYWKEKARHHRDQAKFYKDIGLKHGWKIALGLTFVLCVIGGIGFFSATPDKPSSAYLFLITVGLVITTMAFWATRILVRLYMSEHHLAIDADERATMALTYLALMERGAVEEKDRALILAPLFRPSSDGIVKDDAAPDMSPAGLLSKAMNK